MKMVKSLLLGSAAGLIAVTAGQAADLPVKAKPVEYVKICSLYGAGFYYMPGTDMCIKIGGWVRAEAAGGNIGSSMTWGPFAGDNLNRTTSNFGFRARGYITADAREQTAYGTARGYIAVGVNTNDFGLAGSPVSEASAFSSNRAFVQWAGMTAGLTQSFYDFYSVPAMQYRGGYVPASDTGDPGWMVWGYTAQLGNGVTATVAAEGRRTTQIIDASGLAGVNNGIIAPGSFTTAGTAITGGAAIFPGNGSYGGMQSPDVVANLRVDQTWGSAQISGAAHEVNASYYSAAAGAAPGAPPAQFGHPSDQWGFAVAGGLRLNMPFVTQGDYFQTQVNYTQGALRYLFFTPNGDWGMVNGNQEAFGVLSDCVYGGTAAAAGLTSTTSCQLTTGWGINAGFEHYWTPAVHESFYGDYYAVSYNSNANAQLCSFAGGGNGAGIGTAATATSGCNNNWSTWGVGSRLQWDVTKTFYMGVEVLYDTMKSATLASGATLGGYAGGGGVVPEANAHAWTVSARVHKDFLP